MSDVIGYIKLVRVFDYLLSARGFDYNNDAVAIVSQARVDCTASLDGTTILMLHDTFVDSERFSTNSL